ncbi:uncharacterized protein LOC133166015 isoform X1 [Syngnathus typhle]|uniref:uncharacterized protein LOC133166015 isoform X1 n=1 Tax=Syngnathus typhle TaxID=161592 RepID=UPI002A6A058C|nr:uncharacterized protein LOC133166015 isoform X1 [Syngnathus typhle]XP_061151954.1 uncharacterized protein LOC133166015 isoform X1 [Syngnathus typhle]XP_061151955.1 uncharacterized protein LOC133166015 isoform X1 [Syngnathus typhle]
MYTSRSTPFRQELIIVRTIIFLFLFFPATNSPAPISGATSSPGNVSHLLSLLTGFFLTSCLMYTSRSTPFRQELIIVRTIIFLFLFFPATNSPAPISGGNVSHLLSILKAFFLTSCLMYTSCSTPFRHELIIVRIIIFLFLFFSSFQQPSDHWHCYPPPLVEDLTVYAHIKAVVTFAPGANVTEILQQFILNATRGFCDDDCQIDATVTPAADETPPPS